MGREKVELFVCRTDVHITLGVIGERLNTQELGTVIHIGNGNVGTNALVFDGNQVLFRAVLLVPYDVSRPQFRRVCGYARASRAWVDCPSLIYSLVGSREPVKSR